MARKLEVTIVGDADSLKKALRESGQSVDKFGNKTDQGHGKASKFGAGLDIMKSAAIGGGLALAGGLAYGLKDCVDQFQESEKVGAQTNAVLKSTHGQAGLTAKSIGDLASKLSMKSGIDDETIQSGENLLLTFTNIRNEAGKGNDVFNQTTGIMNDMSVALGQDTKTSAIQLGKALNDPIKGITALRRVGVSFTDAQKEQIATMVGAGDTMGAQKVILAELTKEFGGSAEAAGNTTTGAFNKLKVAVGNVEEAIGGALAPVIKDVAKWLSEFVGGIQDGTGAGGKFARMFNDVKTAIGTFFKEHRHDFDEIGKSIKDIAENALPILSKAWEFMKGVAAKVIPGLVQMVKGFAQTIKGVVEVISGILTLDFDKAWKGVQDIFGGAIDMILGSLKQMTAPAREALGKVMDAVGEVISGAATAVGDAASTVVKTVLDVFKGLLDPAKKVGTDIIHALGKGIGAAGNLLGDARDKVKDVFTGFTHIVGDGFKTVKDFGVDIIHGLGRGLGAAGNLIGDAAEAVKDVFTGFTNKLGDGFKEVKDFGVDIIHAVGSGIGAAGNLINDAATAIGDVWTGFTKILGEGASKAKDFGVDIIHAVGQGLASVGGFAKTFANAVIKAINSLHIHLDLPSPIPDIKWSPKIPYLAKGTDNFGGGMAVVGERGPELLNLPRGSQVIPADRTRSLLTATNNTTDRAGASVVIQHAEFHNGVDADMLAARLGWQLATA